MSEKYFIKGVSDQAGDYPILSKNEWDDIRISKAIISNVLNIEQKYDVMISNYYEFEETLLKQALDHSIWRYKGKKLDTALLTNTRRIINLITSVVLYGEQVRGGRTSDFIFKDEDTIDIISDFDNKLKKSINYNFIRRLRNFSAHSNLPVNSISYTSSWEKIEKSEKENLGHYIIPFVLKEKLLGDDCFSKKFLEAIEEDDKGRIDLRYYIRKAIAELSKNHEDLRTKIKEGYESAKETYISVIKRYKEYSKKKFYTCRAVKEINGDLNEEIFIHKNNFDRIELFFSKNKSQGLLERRYVHNRL